MKLRPSTAKLYHYDGTPLTMKGEINFKVQKGQQAMPGRFVLVEETPATSYHCSVEIGHTHRS